MTAVRSAPAGPAPARPDDRGPAGRTLAWGVALTGVLLVSITLAVAVGPARIGAWDVWRSVAHHAGLGVDPLPRLQDGIVWQLRMPRVLTAALVGAGLALSGAIMQTLTRNPLADPYLLGLSSGASLGAVAVLLLGMGLALPVAAFAGSMAAMAATLALARSAGGLSPTRTVLAGVAVAQLCGAATSFVVFFSSAGDAYREILGWLMGSLGNASWTSVLVTGPVVVVVGLVLVGFGPTLDAFAFGDVSAAALGIDVARVRWLLLSLVALLTGAAVSVSGAIGFVGLTLPHAVRLLTGTGHRRLLPLVALVGASFLIWADTLARTAFDPRELPVGIITALLGAPVFAVLLRRGAGRAGA